MSPEYRPDHLLPPPEPKSDKELKKIWRELANNCDEYNLEEPFESLYSITAEYPLEHFPFVPIYWDN